MAGRIVLRRGKSKVDQVSIFSVCKFKSYMFVVVKNVVSSAISQLRCPIVVIQVFILLVVRLVPAIRTS